MSKAKRQTPQFLDLLKTIEHKHTKLELKTNEQISKTSVASALKEQKQQESICLIRDNNNRFVTFTTIVGHKYVVTSPSCTHGIDYNLRFSSADVREKGLESFTLSSARELLPTVPSIKLIIACDECVPKEWQCLTHVDFTRLVILNFDLQQEIFIEEGKIKLLKPSNWYDVQGKCVVVDGSHHELALRRYNLEQFVHDISSDLKNFNFPLLLTDLENEVLGSKLAKEFGCLHSIHSPPFLTESIEISIDALDDDVFALNPVLVDDPIIVTSVPESNILIESVEKGIRIRGGKDAYLQQQFLPFMIGSIQDRTLYRLIQNALKYWLPLIEKATSGQKFIVGIECDNFITLKNNTLIDLFSFDQYNPALIIDEVIAPCFIEKSHLFDFEIILYQYDETVAIKKL